MSELEALNTVYKRVSALLDEKPYTKGDYRLLDAMYLSSYHGVSICRFNSECLRWLPVEFEELRALPGYETINRAFRLLQARGKRPTHATLEKREAREHVIKHWVRHADVGAYVK